MFTTVILFSLVLISIILVGVMFVLFRQMSTLEKYQAALDDAAEQMLAMSRALHSQNPSSYTDLPQPDFSRLEQVPAEHRRISTQSPVVSPHAGGYGSQVELVSYPIAPDNQPISGASFPQLTAPMTGHIPLGPTPLLQYPGPPGIAQQSPPPIPCEQCGAPLQDDLLYCVKCGKTHSSLLFPGTGSNPSVAPLDPMQSPYLAIDPELFPDARTVKTIRPSEEELQNSAYSTPDTSTDVKALVVGPDMPSPLDLTPRDRTLREAPGAKAASASATAGQQIITPSLPSELYTREHSRPDELLKDASALLDLAQSPEELGAPANTPVPTSPDATNPNREAPSSGELAGVGLATPTGKGPADVSLNMLAQVFPPDIDQLLRSTSSYPTAVQVFRPGTNDTDDELSDSAIHTMESADFDEALHRAKEYLDIEEDAEAAQQFLLGMAINHVEAADSAILTIQRIDENAVADIPSEEALEDRSPLYQLHMSIAIGDQFDALLDANIPIDQGMLGYCIEERAGLLIDDASLEASFQQGALHDAGLSLGSFLCAPLTHEEALFGVLLLRNPPEDEPFSLSELHILTYISHLIAEVLHNDGAMPLPSGEKASETDVPQDPTNTETTSVVATEAPTENTTETVADTSASAKDRTKEAAATETPDTTADKGLPAIPPMVSSHAANATREEATDVSPAPDGLDAQATQSDDGPTQEQEQPTEDTAPAAKQPDL